MDDETASKFHCHQIARHKRESYQHLNITTYITLTKTNKKAKSVDKPGSVVDNHLSGTNVTICLMQPTLILHGPCINEINHSGSLFGLAPSGVYHAASVTK